MNCSLPGSSDHGISQARILEWVAISFSRWSSPPKDWTWVSCIDRWFFTTEPSRKPWRLLGVAKSDSFTKDGALHPQFPFDIGFAWTFTQQTHFWKCLAVLFLIIWGYSTFSIVSAPIYIPTLLFSTFISSFWKKLFKYVWGDKSLWFSFSLSWWLVRLRSFSFTPWPFVSSLEKMSIQVLCSFFKLGCLYFFYWVVWISYVFWLFTLYHIDGLQIFSYSLGSILILSIAAFAVQKVLV